MPTLLIDNSNTRTKFAVTAAGGGVGPVAWIPTSSITLAELPRHLGDLQFDCSVICSVVPEKRELLRGYLGSRGSVHVLDHRSPLGLGIDYPDPTGIGADRLANAVGVTARHGAPAIVIDFGTAVTFDVISSAPAYCGGVIAPGLGAMTDYLARKTALLPDIRIEEPPAAIGKSTVGAMQAGAVIGYRGLVREILAAIREEMGEPAKAIATGGDAALIAKGVREIDGVDPGLTLEGLRIIATRLFD